MKSKVFYIFQQVLRESLKVTKTSRCKYQCGPKSIRKSVWECDPERAEPEWNELTPCFRDKNAGKKSRKEKCEALEKQPEWSSGSSLLRCQNGKGVDRFRRRYYKCFAYCPDQPKTRMREKWVCDGYEWKQKTKCNNYWGWTLLILKNLKLVFLWNFSINIEPTNIIHHLSAFLSISKKHLSKIYILKKNDDGSWKLKIEETCRHRKIGWTSDWTNQSDRKTVTVGKHSE